MSTLNQIITELETFATIHEQISEFYEGDMWEYATGKTNVFPVLTCTILGNSLSDNNLNDGAADNFKFQIGVFDRLHDDYSNRREALSDTNSICKDLIAYFKNNPNLADYNISFGDLTDYVDKTDNCLAGWFFDFTITIYNQLDYCGIPLVVVPAGNNNPYVQIWYDNLVGAKPSQPLLDDLNVLYNSLTGEELTLFHPICGMETDEQRLKPIISTSGDDFLSQGSFTLDNEGFLSDGATGYIDSKWNGTDDGGVLFVIDSAAIGVFVKTNPDGSFCAFGSSNPGSDYSYIFPNISGISYMGLHQSANSAIVIGGTEKHFTIKRTDSSTVDLYTDGVFQLSDFQPQATMTNYNLYIGARNTANFPATLFLPQYVRGVYTGSKDVNITLMNSAFNTYLTSRGL